MSYPATTLGIVNGQTRATLVQEAARRWRSQLIDLGGRNTLLYYKDLRSGTLDLSAADPVAVAALLGGRTMSLSPAVHPFLQEACRRGAGRL